MKTIVVVLLLVALGVGAFAINEHHKLSTQQTELATLHQQLDEETNQFKALEVARQHWERRQQDMLAQIDVLAAQVMASRAAESNKVAAALSPTVDAASNSPSTTTSTNKKPEAGFGKMMASMMKDPAMRQFIRDQQRTMVDQLYSPFVKKMGLSPEDADKFKNLLADHMVSGADKAAAMFGGGDSANRTEALKSMAADQKANEQQIHDFLGDEGFAQYQEYQKTASERMQLNAFRQQAGADYSLTDQQSEQLLSFMSEEKQAAAANGQTPPDQSQRQAGLQAALSDDQTEKLLQTQETINQRVYDRAQAILSPDQLTAFGKFQNSQLQMMRMGMSMARKMFGNDTAPAPAPSGQ
jgi:hypothetical protein